MKDQREVRRGEIDLESRQSDAYRTRRLNRRLRRRRIAGDEDLSEGKALRLGILP